MLPEENSEIYISALTKSIITVHFRKPYLSQVLEVIGGGGGGGGGAEKHKLSPILVTLKSRYDSPFELSNTNFSGNKLDGVDLNSYRHVCGIQKNKERSYAFRQTDGLKGENTRIISWFP